MIIKYVIINNDSASIDIIKENLSKFKEFDLIGEFNNAIEGIKFVEENNLDLIILDTSLPDLPGINFLYSLINPPNSIVIAESSEYAIECFDLNVVDYLLKPLSIQKLFKAINKFLTKYRQSKNEISSSVLNKHNIFKLEINNKVYNIKLDNIILIESMRGYIKIHYEKEEPLTIKYVLSNLEAQLPKNQFIRVHKSYILSIRKIRSYSNKYIEIADIKIPIGSFYKKETMNVLLK